MVVIGVVTVVGMVGGKEEVRVGVRVAACKYTNVPVLKT